MNSKEKIMSTLKKIKVMGETSRSGGLLGWSRKVTLELRSHWDNGQTEGRAQRTRVRTKLAMFEIQKRSVWLDGNKEGTQREMQSEVGWSQGM